MTSHQQHNDLRLTDAVVSYDARFLSSALADHFLEQLTESLEWRQDQIQMFGRPVPIPRLQAWYGDTDAHYRYSGLNLQPQPWTRELCQLLGLIEEQTGVCFNSVLANLYRDGQDSVGWHSDNEPELGPSPIIASLTLGAVRRFCLRHKKHKDQQHQLQLEHGSLLIMAGETQQHWLHALPKTKRPTAPRINLSFRQIVQTR
ncbi:DNA repair protein [Motiliproteus sp. MSK22-1]|nr:DNA repair protein [Motiliproteus sp. MSK22-1]